MSYQFPKPSARSNRSNRFRRFSMFHGIAVGVVMLIALVSVGFSVFGAVAIQGSATSCSITDKDRTQGYKGASTMRVYATCAGSSETKVFSVADNWAVGQFASADTYANIKIGHTYNLELRGARVPVINQFENVIKATEVTEAK